MPEATKEMNDYLDSIQNEVNQCWVIASKARSQGFDPEHEISIKLARNMAERVEGLIGVVAPQLIGSGVTKKIIELEKKYSPSDWRVALVLALEVAKQKFCKFKDEKEAVEVGIRTGFAYHTGGIVAAPLEGFIELKIKETKDGKKYLASCYAGPIRGAGGTGAAFSVLLTDYLRVKLGFAKYDPGENEINRLKTEIMDYHERVTNLQYLPSLEEIEFLAKNLPVEVDGDPTEKFEVSNYKDLPRIETNMIRGGVCLVLAEGMAQKATKLWKRLEKWGEEMGLEWGFLKEFLELQKKIKARKEKPQEKKITPNYTYISDLVAGRPVLTFPMRAGGFRLRYGRTRISGFSAAGIHPATMFLLKKYIATGTQLKVERPGKAAAITPCDSIEGPIVQLENGTVLRIDSIEKAKKYSSIVKEILYLGDILFNYGDFSENGHILVPCGYNEEGWVRDLEKATVEMFGALDIDKLSDLCGIDREDFELIMNDPVQNKISAESALILSKKLNIPLHPYYTFHWNMISLEELEFLFRYVKTAKIMKEDKIVKTIFKYNEHFKKIINTLGIPHLITNNEFIVIGRHYSEIFLFCLGYDKEFKAQSGTTAIDVLSQLTGIKIKDKSGTFIGARMGRPEKAKIRKMIGSPHALFPVGDEGGRLRCFQSALEAGKVYADFPIYKCNKCNNKTIYSVCELCGSEAKKLFFCRECGETEKPSCKHGECHAYKKQEIDIKHYYEDALKKVNGQPELVKGVRGTSNKDHIPEHLIKGILRAKHNVHINKDGTVRFDMSELPMTHFIPSEIGTNIEKLKQIGYTKDIYGKTLENEHQILELKPQDIVLPATSEALDEPANAVLFNVANFIDELMVSLYKLSPYYNLKSKNDLVGNLVVGLAPHISAGMVGRIIGFSNTQGMFAHPLFHAALRRDCDGDEASVSLLMDALLNFSNQFLPNSRGAKTMDAPLVMTSILNPAEVDDQVHGLDVVWRYPLELYEAAEQYKAPWDIKIEQIKDRLGKETQYEDIGYTHNVSSINMGVVCSAYKSLPSMEEKLKGQMEIAKMINAVDASGVARLVIEKHFLKDTKGNLRKFSQQEFRCVKCNEKYRRPPLRGYCIKCNGRIIFTITEGSVIKYLGPSISLAKEYNVHPYLQQTLDLLKRRVESLFGKEKEVQQGLGEWFNT